MLFLGNLFSLMSHHVCKWKSHNQFNLDTKLLGHRHLWKHSTVQRKTLIKNKGGFICSYTAEKDLNLQLSNARVIYSVAPALGHNQVYSIFCSLS